MAIEHLLTEQDVAEIIGVPRGTIRKWRGTNKGPRFIRAGKHIRYQPKDVEYWLNLGWVVDTVETYNETHPPARDGTHTTPSDVHDDAHDNVHE